MNPPIVRMSVSQRNKVIVIRALPGGADSRVLRWGDIYKLNEKIYCGWGRSSIKSDDILGWRPSSGSIFIAPFYFIFSLLCFFKILILAKKNDIIVFVDLETILIGIFAAKLKKAIVHFDIADPFGMAKPVPFELFWKTIEKIYISYSDIATVPHEIRAFYYFNKIPKNVFVVENVPNLKISLNKPVVNEKSEKLIDFIVIGYFGTLERHRGLEDLINLVKNNNDLLFTVAGRGEISEYIKLASKECSRINYLGEFIQSDLPSLVAAVDVYCSLYYRTKKLHTIAAPNKYFEHLALGKSILISSGVVYGSDVVNNKTGWIVDDGLSSLQHWYDYVSKNKLEIDEFSSNAADVWNSNYFDWLDSKSKKLTTCVSKYIHNECIK